MDNALSASIIKATCKAKPVTISKMLADCRISKSLIYDMEKRDQTPSVDVYSRIADYLGCSVDYLLGRVPAPSESGSSDCQGQSDKNLYSVVIQDFCQIVKDNLTKIFIA